MLFLKSRRRAYLGVAVFFSLAAVATTVGATHSWGGYHWARTANPFTLKLGDNVSGAWDSYLLGAAGDWSQSVVLDTVAVPGTKDPKSCKPTAGQVEVCSSKYGNTRWLGVASIWASGTHITKGVVKMNDTYFNRAAYNTSAWRNLVMCQEVGHTLGLDHQDENFSNTPLGTCMDYSDDPTLNQHPNQDDYDMLETIYAHLDTTTTVAQSVSSAPQEVDHLDQNTWGKEIRRSRDGRVSLHERDFGNGEKIFTFVFWTDEKPNGGHEK